MIDGTAIVVDGPFVPQGMMKANGTPNRVVNAGGLASTCTEPKEWKDWSAGVKHTITRTYDCCCGDVYGDVVTTPHVATEELSS